MRLNCVNYLRVSFLSSMSYILCYCHSLGSSYFLLHHFDSVENCMNFSRYLPENVFFLCVVIFKNKVNNVSFISRILNKYKVAPVHNTGLFISPSGTCELDCATTKKDTAERSISIGRESLKVFFWY